METFEEIRKRFGFGDQTAVETAKESKSAPESFEDIRKRFGFGEQKKSPAAQQQGEKLDFQTIRQMFGMNNLQQKRQDDAKQVVDSYVADITAFSKKLSDGGMNYSNYQDAIQEYTQQRDSFIQRTNALIGYLNRNADLYETESLDGMLQWLEQNKTYLQNVGAGLDQQKGFYDSFISEKDYILYDTYKDTSAEELREIAKTQQDWETRDWMEKRAAALEYKAPRALDVIDGELKTVKEQLKQQEEKDLKALEEWSLWFSTEGASSPYAKAPANGGVSEETQALQKRLAALETERQAAVSQERAASAPTLPETVEELDAELARIQEEINISFANDQRRAADMGVALVSKSKKTEELEATQTQLMQKRAAILAEDLLENKYAYAMEAPDFGDKSKYAGMKNILADSDYGYINGDKRAEDLYDYTLNNPRQRLLGVDRSWVTRMREDEKKIYNYLYNTEGRSKANEFLSELEPVLLKRQREDEERFARWDAQEDPWGTSIATVLSAPLKPLAFVGQTIDSLDGRIDPNAAYNRNLYTSKAIREEVPKNWGPVGSFAYQTGMSMADFLTTTAVAGGNPTIAMTIMGSGAAADTTLEALDRGLGSGQAYTLGVVAGIAEALTERFSLDALLDKTALTKSALGYWLKNVLAEGSEEVSSSLINNFADLMISKDKSQWAESVQTYKDKGYSDSEAFWKAMGDQAASLGLDFLGGAASGGVIGIPGVVMKGTGLVSNTQNQGTPQTVQQTVEPGAVQTPAGVTNAPQVAVQNPVAAEQNPAVAEQTTVKTEQQPQVPSQSGEISTVINNREAMQRKLQAAEEAYKTGVISKKELRKIRREAETLNITSTIPETDRVDIDRARAAYEAGEIDEDTYYQIEDAYREQQEQLGTAPAVDEEIQYTENENQELSFAQQQRLAESQKEGANYESEDFEPTLIGNGGLVGGFIRKSVPDGGNQRVFGTGTRGEAGQLSGSAAEQTATANPGRAAIQRRNLAQNLRLDKVSSEELLPGQGTESKKNTILPAETWDTQMQEVAERVKQETGMEVVYVLGGIEVKTKHGTKTVNGVYDGNQIIIQADHLRFSIEQIADHEMYHALIDATGNRYQMITRLRDYVLERYDADSFNKMIDRYIADLSGVIDVTEDMPQEAWEDALLRVMEEIFADAYAGINAFGAHAEQLQEIVRPWAQENMLPQTRKQDNGTRQTNGPNEVRFSTTQEEQMEAGKKESTAEMSSAGATYLSAANMTEQETEEGRKLADFIGQVNRMIDKAKRSKRKYRIGNVSQNHARVINSIMQSIKPGFDVSGYELWIDGTGAVHIEDRHGEFGNQDHSMSSEEAKMLIPWAAQNATSGRFILKPNGNLKLSERYRDSNGKPAPEICLEKAGDNNTVYVSECVPDSANKRIWITSAYIKKGSNGQVLNMEDTSLQLTPEAPVDGNATTNIVATDEQTVKPQFSGGDDTDYRFSVDDGQDNDRPAYEQETQEALEELRVREESEYGEVKEKLASGELKPREQLTTKAKNHLQKAERKLLNKIRYALHVPRVAAREYLKGTVEQLSAEFLATGRFTQETVDRLFEDAWNQGVIEDREFYDTYKPVKDFLRTTAVTIRETDQKDIADYRDFKRRSWGTLKIVNEGGQSVDSVYSELMDMAPGLFPADISHPADQLQRMYDVAKSITITEQNLRSIGGEFGRQMKLEAREAFEDAMQDVRADLRNVKRSADDLAERKRSEQEKPVYDSVEKVIEAYENMKKARRTADKAVAQNLLTARDEMLVGRLLRGEIFPEDLNPETDNVAGITEVYEAKKAYEALAKPLVEYKKKMKAHLLRKADSFLETAISWKDKKSVLAYSRETMRRNIQDIVPDKALAKEIIEYFFEPVQKAEAQRTRFKTEMRQRVAALGLSQKVEKGNIVSESHAVQLLGEAEDNIQCLENAKGYMKTRDGKTLEEWQAVIRELWEQNPNLDKAKIQNAVEAARAIYDELFKLMNEVRVRFGYEPVNYRRGYFPHFQMQADGIMAWFGKALGIDTTVTALPTRITGITHTFKPGIRWFGNTLERLGFATTYDFVGGFDMYIEGVSDVIYQTENIQNLRALAAQIRYRTTDDGIREQIDQIKANDQLTEAQKDVQIKDVYEHGEYVLNNFIRELDDYTNLLANKKSSYDRLAEEKIGRTTVYRIGKLLNSRVAANMVVGNLTTPLTNLIPITQAMSRTGTINMLHGMWESAWNSVKQNKLLRRVFNITAEPDGIDDMSDFLTSRRGSELLSKSAMEKAEDIAGAFMEAMDRFASGSVVRAEYYHNLKKGLTAQEAMHQADLFAAGVIGDRSKGSMPTVFASQFFKFITGFQLEVNNQISEIFKDMPRYYDDEEKGKLIVALLAYFVGAYIFNDVYELVTGRRAAMDPLYILNELSGDIFGYQLPSVYEITQNGFSFKTEQEENAGIIVKDTVSNILSEIPFNSLLGLLGVEGGGRVPVASAMPDLAKLATSIFDSEADALYKWSVAQEELLGTAVYVIPPFGGAQITKMAKGIRAIVLGGSYTINKDGEQQLQYPIYTDTAGQAIWNGFKSVVLGKNSTGGALEWVGSNFDTFSAKHTEVYRQMVAAGVKQRDAFDLVNELRHIRKTEEETQKFLQRRALQNSDVSDDGKLVAYNGIIASESEQDLIVALTGVDDNSGAILKTLYGMKEAEDLEGEEKTKAKLQVLDSSGLNAEGQLTAFYDLLAGESEREAIEELDTLGADSASVYEAVRNIREAKLLEGDAEASTKWQAVADADLTDDQKNVLAGSIFSSTEMETESGEPSKWAKLQEGRKRGLSWSQYAKMVSYEITLDSYLKYTSEGLSSDKAIEALIETEGVEPMEGKEQLADVQKYLVIAERPWNETMKDMALEGIMSESAYEKYRAAADAGIRTYIYITFLYDINGWTSDKDKSKQDKIVEYIDGLNLTVVQKDALYLTLYTEKNLHKTPWHR